MAGWEKPCVIVELSLNVPGPVPEGELHPETTPVGPFPDWEAADKWAKQQAERYGGSASWVVAPMRDPSEQGYKEGS